MSLKSLRQCVDYADGLATVAAAHAVISHPNTAPQEIARATDVVELLMYGVQTPAEQKAEVLS